MLNESTRFNYIITIHNKENLIENVMLGIFNSAGPNSTIYPVLDGCSDRSEAIIDDMIKSHPHTKIIKLYGADVHELKSINIGLTNADQSGPGFNIILQDDVILLDAELEEECKYLYNNFDLLGLVSFRHGGNISRKKIRDRLVLDPWDDYVQNQCGHYPNVYQTLNTGYFTFREVIIKSPICIPFKIVREIGIPDDIYAPWDDISYSYRVSCNGYSNGVFAIDFQSDVSWGTTRTRKQKFNVEHVMRKNLDMFRKRNSELPPLDLKKYNNKVYQIFMQ